MKGLRAALAEGNSVEAVKKYYDDNKWYEGIPDDEMFCFGGEFGDGADAKHFHMGFTSITLMKRLEAAEAELHLDGTYRLLRIAFPVMVLGISDI